MELIPQGSLAEQCVARAKSNLTANPGSKLISPTGSTVGHAAVELPNGVVLDPTLRDNLAAYGQMVDDIPVGQEAFTRADWEIFVARFPRKPE
jgi:hypothetical protein